MKATRSLAHLVVVALSLSPAVSAWSSWPRWLPDPDSLVVRADSTSTSDAPASTGESSQKPTNTDADSTGSSSGTVTDKPTGTQASKSGSGTKSSGKGKHTMFDPNAAPGSVHMVTPAATAGSALYKIGDQVTWGWNYTDLQGKPTAIDVLVSCSKASATWTLTQNMTFATKGSYTWDTDAYQHTAIESPLLTEEYTLVIYDAESSISATAEPGYLAPFTGFTFGLYTPRPYTPLGEWKCATCSAGVSDMERRGLGVVLAMSLVTVLSFTWFVTGLGVLA